MKEVFYDRTDLSGSVSEPFPLSPAQLGIWFAQHVDPNVPINIAHYIELNGHVDVHALVDAGLMAARDLDSYFVRVIESDSGEPMQVVDHTLTTGLMAVDLRNEADPEAAAIAWIRADYSRPVDLERDRLMATALLRLADERFYWYSRVHHIVLDGYGAMNLINRIAECYTAIVTGGQPSSLKPISLQQLVDNELEYRESTRFQSDRDHWASRVAGLEQGTSLTGRTAPPVAINDVSAAQLSAAQTEGLTAAVARYESSEAGLLLAAFAAYLGLTTDNTEVILSLPVTARVNALMRRSAGMMSNIVPLRFHVGEETTVSDLVAAVAVEVAGALRHQRYRHEDIRRDGTGASGVSSSKEFFGPWVNIMLFKQQLTFGTIEGRYHILSTGSIEDLGVNFYQSTTDDGVVRNHIDFESNPNLYTTEEARQHHQRFLEFFDRFVAAGSHTPVRRIPVLGDAERRALLVEWNATNHVVTNETLAEALAESFSRHAHRIAVSYEGEDLTYAELGERVERLARHLAAMGVGPESFVAVGIRRSIELVVAIYAILRAGGAYVPIDPDHPSERIGYILESSQPVCVLTTRRDELVLPEDSVVIEVDTFEAAGEGQRAELRAPQPDNTAYVIYTSGSTGRPKGVAVEHRAIINQIRWMLAEYRLDESDVYLQKTATTFDVSLWGWFMPVLSGGKLVVATHDGHRDPGYVAAVIAREGVTITDFVPSMLTVFANQVTAEDVASLREVFVIGEALPPETCAAFRAISAAGLHNLYGPTEAAVSVTYWQSSAADKSTVPIGLPEWNVQVYVLDTHLRPAPIGLPGELYLAGAQLARGYVGRPDLSSDRFVANPYGPPGSRMYRTGDLVRWNAHGALEYYGRLDFQVKFRGQRIELGEIESELLALPEVTQAVVLVAETPTGQQLAAYIVGASAQPALVTQALIRRLPSYMIPTSVIVLDAFPLNASGKLDRKALPEPEFTSAAYRAPSTVIEEIVAGIFAEVLGAERVGADDDFFALGGNSLLATGVVARLGSAFDARVPVRLLFEAPAVSGLAARLESLVGQGGRKALVARPRPLIVPLSLAQQRMWFLNRFDRESAAYNMPAAIRLRGRLDIQAMRRAILDVVARHEVLRTIYPESENGPVQVVLPASQTQVTLDVKHVDEAGLIPAVVDFSSQVFDVTTEVPLRVGLFHVGGRALRSVDNEADDEYVLALVAQHIAADGVSMVPLARDVMVAYSARAMGEAPAWSPLPVQY
ncbi:MAG: amino acid adenylation domain-containing protein, partial [Nocardiaceae bacterium]|nr:amino acid adenylation domain-containing protein [Nocardiaceae bacterium]